MEVSKTLAVSDTELTKYADFPLGESATPTGTNAVGIVALMLPDRVSITETVFESRLVARQQPRQAKT